MDTTQVRKRKKIREPLGDRILMFFVYTFVVLLCLTVIYPFWDILVESFTSTSSIGINRLWPQRPTLEMYRLVFLNKYIGSGYRETIIITALGTVSSMVATIIGAYVLSKKQFPLNRFFSLMVVIPMFFSGGLIPTYLWNVQLGLRNTRLVLFLPALISSYNLIVMRNFFNGVPHELEESAWIDGASNVRILFSVYLPVSKAVIATVSLWLLVGYWNDWFACCIYINKTERYVLQVVLRRILNEANAEMLGQSNANVNLNSAYTENLKAATIYVCTAPILLVYPFLQKYFVKGTLVGSIKG